MIRHIVMWKFREGEEENREKFLSGLQALDGVIPEIRHMEIHRSCKPGNPYDACLIADFDDLEALSRYKNDPRHVAVSTLCKSIRESRGAIDYELCKRLPWKGSFFRCGIIFPSGTRRRVLRGKGGKLGASCEKRGCA